MTTTWRQDLHQLIKSVSENKGILLTYPLMVEFLQGDHIASIFINQVFYWTDRTTDPDGWFYKTFDEWNKELQLSYYQVNRVIYGDKRVANPKRTLSELGLETKVKMAKNGRNATFYRLNVPLFTAMFVEWLQEKFGKLPSTVLSQLPVTEESPTGHANPIASNPIQGESELDWQTPTPPTPLIPNDRVHRPCPIGNSTAEVRKPMTELWKATSLQLKNHFDRRTFETYIKPLTLVDYLPDEQRIVVTTPHLHHLTPLKHTLNRAIQGHLKWVCGQAVQVSYLTDDEWHQRLC